MEKFAVDSSCVLVLYLFLNIFGAGLLAFLVDLLSLADRSGSGKALAAYEKVRI